MPKKFYDVIPPNSKKEEKPVLEEKKEEVSKEKPVEPKKRIWFKSLIFSVLGLVIVALVGFFFFSDIKIEIWPQQEFLDFDYQILLSKEAGENPEVWFETEILPVEEVEVQKTKESNFMASARAEVEKRAEGVIRVYNAHSTYDQPLVANTRFVSSEGKLFRSLEREVVKGGHYEGGEFVPGYTDIEVRAAEPGKDYNIGPTTFSIPGFAGTEKFTTFYGKSFEDMKEGFVGEVAQAAEEDLAKAEEEVVSGLKEENSQFLKDTLSEKHILLKDSISHQVLNTESSVEPEEKSDSFTYKAEIKSQALALREDYVADFAKNLIASMISEDMKIKEETLALNFSVDSLDLEKGEVSLTLAVKASVFKDIELEKVKKSIAGQGLNEAKLFLGRLSGIEKVEVTSWPFWRRSLPKEKEKINLVLRLDR